MTDPYSDFDPIEHGLEEGFFYLDRLVELGTLHGIMAAEAESARDNLATALVRYRGLVNPV